MLITFSPAPSHFVPLFYRDPMNTTDLNPWLKGPKGRLSLSQQELSWLP